MPSAKQRRMVLLVLALAVAGCVVLVFQWHKQREKAIADAAAQRQLFYRSALESYRSVLKAGMSRGQVSDYLQAHRAQFTSICCIGHTDSYAYITRIGQEPPPWYCSGIEVYVGFEFNGPPASERFADTLKEISIVSLPRDCL